MATCRLDPELLQRMTLRQLKNVALALGSAEKDVSDADFTKHPKSAVIRLISSTRMRLRQLKNVALALGSVEKDMNDADDTKDPKAAVIQLIEAAIAKKKEKEKETALEIGSDGAGEEEAPKPFHEQELDEKKFENEPGGIFIAENDDGKVQYKKLGRLGNGAQASVFVCQNVSRGKECGKEYAVKMFKQTFLNPNKSRRFPRKAPFHDAAKTKQRVALEFEIEILMELKGHKRIVNIVDHCETALHFFLVMEVAKEGDLWDAVYNTRFGTSIVDDTHQPQWNQALSEQDARYIFRQLLDAVSFMHSKRILHRDIKPENILVESIRSKGYRHYYDVKIADFGSSKLFPPDPEAPPGGLLRTSTRIGTQTFAPPEVVYGKLYDQKADYWCLGQALYFMVTGRLCFGRDGVTGKSGNEFKIPPQARLTSQAESLIIGLLNFDDTERYGKDECLSHEWMTQEDDRNLLRVSTQDSPTKRESVEVLSLLLVSKCQDILYLEKLSDVQKDAPKEFDNLVEMIVVMQRTSNLFLQEILPNVHRCLTEIIGMAAIEESKAVDSSNLDSNTSFVAKIDFLKNILSQAKVETLNMSTTCAGLLGQVRGPAADSIQADTTAPDCVREGTLDFRNPNWELIGKLFLAPVLLPTPARMSDVEIAAKTHKGMSSQVTCSLGRFDRNKEILCACAELWARSDAGIEQLLEKHDLRQEIGCLAKSLRVEDQRKWFELQFSQSSQLWSCVKRLSKDFEKRSSDRRASK